MLSSLIILDHDSCFNSHLSPFTTAPLHFPIRRSIMAAFASCNRTGPSQRAPAQPRSDLGSPTNPRVNPVAPSAEATVFLVPAVLGVGLALRTSVAVDASGVVAFRLEVARRHPRDLPQGLEIVLGDVVVMVVCASGIGAGICTVQEVNVAEFELLDALDVFVGDGLVEVVDPLTQSVSIDSGGGHGRSCATFGGRSSRWRGG